MIQIPLFNSSVILTIHLSPLNCKELFNLCHTSARNIIEHIFGILKQQFRILLLPTKFPLHVQARIPTALSALHNIICTNHSDHDDPSESDSDEHNDNSDNQQHVYDQHVDRSEVEDNAVGTSMSLCLYSIPFTFYPTALLLSLYSELFLVAKTGLSLYIPDHAECVWTTRFTLLVYYRFTFYWYHQPPIGLSGAESIWLDISLRPST